jgi:chemotaxis protein MotB
MKNICVAFVCCLSLFSLSCVSSKKLKSAQAEYLILEGKYNSSQTELNKCNDEKSGLLKERADLQQRNSALDNQLTDLNRQLDFMKQNNTTVLKQLQDLSVISASQAESIRKSLENIGAKDAYITDLQRAIASKDSLNMILVMNLKSAIGNLDDKDINIKVDKGVVYIDISDKMLFTSGKYEVTAQAKEVLGKVAAVLKNQPNIEFMVEGHTDNVPYRSGVLLDNWDLSVKRATAVVRILQNQYGLDNSKIN